MNKAEILINKAEMLINKTESSEKYLKQIVDELLPTIKALKNNKKTENIILDKNFTMPNKICTPIELEKFNKNLESVEYLNQMVIK